MRSTWIALTILPLAACSEGVTFDLDSTMQAQTRGVALFDWNDTGVAGMFDQTCAFDFRRGVVLGDVVDLPGQDDRVVDGDGQNALVTSAGEAWMVSEWGESWRVETSLAARTAAFSQDGVVVVGEQAGDCAVDWADRGDMTAIPSVDCGAASVAAGWESDGVFVADGAVVGHVHPVFGFTAIEANADLLAWDDRTAGLIIARTGGEHVRAVESDGETRWTVRVDGAVASVDVLGWEGLVVVTFERPDGLGEVVVLSNEDGSVRADHVTPVVADVTASPGGDAVALVTDSEVHFYEVDPRVAAIELPAVQPETQQAFGD
jgi:hypothetical protein